MRAFFTHTRVHEKKKKKIFAYTVKSVARELIL